MFFKSPRSCVFTKFSIGLYGVLSPSHTDGGRQKKNLIMCFLLFCSMATWHGTKLTWCKVGWRVVQCFFRKKGRAQGADLSQCGPLRCYHSELPRPLLKIPSLCLEPEGLGWERGLVKVTQQGFDFFLVPPTASRNGLGIIFVCFWTRLGRKSTWGKLLEFWIRD